MFGSSLVLPELPRDYWNSQFRVHQLHRAADLDGVACTDVALHDGIHALMRQAGVRNTDPDTCQYALVVLRQYIASVMR